LRFSIVRQQSLPAVLYTVKDFERLGLPEDDLAKVWLAFSRLQRRVNHSDHSAMNGGV